jgi:hypothetical protein
VGFAVVVTAVTGLAVNYFGAIVVVAEVTDVVVYKL